MNWPMVRLGDMARIENGFAFNSKLFNSEKIGTPIVRIRDVKRGYSQTYFDGDFDEKYVVYNGDVLIGMDGDFNCEKWNGGRALLNQRVCRAVSMTKELDQSYLFFVLPRVLQEIWEETSFVTVKHLSSRKLLAAKIPLPPLEEQKRIAEILSKVDQAIELNQRELSLLEDAVKKPLFPLLPGDTRVVSELVKSISSGKSIKESDDEHSGKRVLKVSAVTKGYFDSAEAKPLPASYFPPNEHKVQKGDLLFSRANTSELVGASAVVTTDPGDIYLPDKLWKITLKADADIHVFWHLMQLGKVRSQISQLATGSSGSMKNISQNSFLSVKVPTVPDEYQEQLSQTVKRMLEIRSQAQRRAAYLRELREALAMRAFSGQL